VRGDRRAGDGSKCRGLLGNPLADAILDHADDRGVEYADPESFDSVTGNGVRATVAGDDVLVGKPGWLEAEGVDLSDAGDGSSGYSAVGSRYPASSATAPRRRPHRHRGRAQDRRRRDCPANKDAGITPVMITGDNERTAQAVAEEVGIERVMADVLPDEKREEIGRQDDGERITGSRTSSERRSDGNHRVAMVGDGINDAPRSRRQTSASPSAPVQTSPSNRRTSS